MAHPSRAPSPSNARRRRKGSPYQAVNPDGSRRFISRREYRERRGMGKPTDIVNTGVNAAIGLGALTVVAGVGSKIA